MLAAAVACAPGGPGWQSNCAQCSDPELRRAWGCDEPTTEPQAELTPCPECNGKDEECPRCDGTNRMPVFRCPNALVTREHIAFVQQVALLESGILPDEGGWVEQAATFTAGFPIVQRELTHWREVAREQAARKAGRS